MWAISVPQWTKKILIALFCMSGCWPGRSLAQTAVTPTTTASPTLGTTNETSDPRKASDRRPIATHRPTIGITFEGGGALGLAHVGVMLWLEDHRIPVDAISGTSMGALVGAFFAAGHSAADVKALMFMHKYLYVEEKLYQVVFRRGRLLICSPHPVGQEHSIVPSLLLVFFASSSLGRSPYPARARSSLPQPSTWPLDPRRAPE